MTDCERFGKSDIENIFEVYNRPEKSAAMPSL